jgi:hypothetical protein
VEKLNMGFEFGTELDGFGTELAEFGTELEIKAMLLHAETKPLEAERL